MGDMSMIDRVATALMESVGDTGPWDFYGPDIKEFRGYARKVIEAMREPTEAMEQAGNNADWPDPYNPTNKSIWQAMIDGALKQA